MATEPQPLRPYIAAVAISLAFFAAANVLLYFVLVHPTIAAPAPAGQAESAASVPAPAGNLLSVPDQWHAAGGQWTFDGSSLHQTQQDGFDYAFLYQQPAAQPHMTVRLHHDNGVGGGLIFNAVDSTAKSAAHLVRYLDAATFIWGYFDATGAFNVQGTAAVPDPGSALHTLEVRAGPDNYNVVLDGQPVANSVPLVAKGSYVGLTTSQSAVTFENGAVDGLGTPATALATAPAAAAPAAPAQAAPAPAQSAAAAPAAPSSGFQLQPGAGDWVQQDGAIIQRSSQAADLFAALGAVGDAYTLSADVQWAADAPADQGGGLLFAMPAADKLAGAHMVRFNKNGQEVLWGSFNVQGAFQGEGGAALALDPSKPHELRVIAKGASYDIWVDGAPVAVQLPLAQAAGSVGLITYRGPVTFNNFSMSSNSGN